MISFAPLIGVVLELNPTARRLLRWAGILSASLVGWELLALPPGDGRTLLLLLAAGLGALSWLAHAYRKGSSLIFLVAALVGLALLAISQALPASGARTSTAVAACTILGGLFEIGLIFAIRHVVLHTNARARPLFLPRRMADWETWRARMLARGPANSQKVEALLQRVKHVDRLPRVWLGSPYQVALAVHALGIRSGMFAKPTWAEVMAAPPPGIDCADWRTVVKRLETAGVRRRAFARRPFGRRHPELCGNTERSTEQRLTDTERARARAFSDRFASELRVRAGIEAAVPRYCGFELPVIPTSSANLPLLFAASPRLERPEAAALDDVYGLWPTPDALLVCERPVRGFLDLGRLSNPDGPALEFADGFGIFALHGIVIPEPPNTTRRVTLDYLMRTAGEVSHSDLDQYGRPRRLWRAERPGPHDSPVLAIELVNATPEPDGEYRHFWLRVPPTMSTCAEAVAWTFGLSAEQYTPLLEA